MTLHGRNCLFIRGSKEILDQLEFSEGLINNIDNKCAEISNKFFSPGSINILHRTPNYFVFSYEFDNLPIYYYLEKLLNTYPSCWIKNTYSTNEGGNGVWIGQFRDGKPYIQKHEWIELTDVEICRLTDFSR